MPTDNQNALTPRMIRLVEFYKGRCAKSTAHKWINEGKLPIYKVGSMTFVHETFDEFIERVGRPKGGAAE